jgi:hypothetical protein
MEIATGQPEEKITGAVLLKDFLSRNYKCADEPWE